RARRRRCGGGRARVERGSRHAAQPVAADRGGDRPERDAHASWRRRHGDRRAARAPHRVFGAHALGDADSGAITSRGRGGARVASALSRDDVYRVLDGVKDPEVPVLSVVELGIVRDVRIDGGRVTVTVTPTYSGCPAMHAIEHDIRTALEGAGATDIAIETV